jgi:hypothetical protein
MPAYLLYFYIILIGSIFSGCIEPNTEDLWSISVDQTLQTNGYARDISIDNTRLFVAAGEAGAQIWDIDDVYNPLLIKSMPLSAIGIGGIKEISKIHYSPINNLVHLLEYNERAYVILWDDSTYNIQPFGQYGAEDTRDFVVIDSTESFTSYTVIKKDHYLKYNQWVKTTWGDQIIWGDGNYDGEIDVNAMPTSITLSNRTLVLGVGQLGIQIWQVESINTDPIFHYSIDLNGTVKSVNLIDENNLYVSSGSYGASYIKLNDIEVDSANNIISNNNIIHFAQDLNVDHIAVNNGIAALSLGSKGIALYDITDPNKPIEKGIFPIGYTYRSEFWEEKLMVCSREGLQILTIKQ